MKQELLKIVEQNFLSTSHIPYSPIFAKEQNHYISSKYPLFNTDKHFKDEETFLKNYGNPLYKVEKNYMMVVVERTDDKLACKLFYGSRMRKPGLTWFKISKNVDYLTINLKTGDVYTGFIHNFQKKRKCSKHIRKNYFAQKNLNTFFVKIKSLLTNYNSKTDVNEIINFFAQQIFPNTNNSINSIHDVIFKFYLDKKHIKYPNNYSVFENLMFGCDYRKQLKKNDFKVIDTIMKLNNLSGKKIKKILHDCKQVCLDNYHEFKKIFSEEWINQDDFFLKNLITSDKLFVAQNHVIEELKQTISNKELRRIFNIYKLFFETFAIGTHTISDHIYFYVQLKRFGESEIKWMSTNKEEFAIEHLDWSEKIDFYKRGEYTRIYPEYIMDELKKPLELNQNIYYPVVLHDTKSYNQESQVQSNCVKTYIGRPSTFIVSLRKFSEDSEERLTVEYNLHLDDEKVKIIRVQTRGKYNSTPSDDWNAVLNYLDSKVMKLHDNKNYETVKIKKKCANGVELFSDSRFDENGYLSWSVKTIENNYFID